MEKGSDVLNINIIYNPVSLTYEQFYEIDKECFPFEPFNLQNFNEMKMGYFWAAFVDEKIVGYAYVKMNTNDAHLSRIGVGINSRGKGIAKYLMKTITSYCIDHGSHCIDLLVQADNPSAIYLYEQFGFKYLESNYQYIIPICDVISKYKRSSANNLKTISTAQNGIFSESEFGIGQHYNKKQNVIPKRYKLNFIDHNGIIHGNCNLDPGFPGCSTFIINEPDRYFLEALVSLEKYLNPSKETLVLTFADKALMRTCSNLDFKLNYELVAMRRENKLY